MSSPGLAITTSSSGPTTSSIPRASLAPPVPPARTTTGLLSDASPRRGPTRSQARDLDPRPHLVPDVDRDDQRGELLDDPRHLQAPAVHRTKPVDQPHQLGHALLGRAIVTADEHILVQ